MCDKIKEKMKIYTRMTGSTESASRLVEAESRLAQAEVMQKLADALKGNKKRVA